MPMPQIDPAIYDDILTQGQQVGGLDPQIANAQKLADALRAAGMKSPETRMSGRRAVAPSGMELLGNLAMQSVGNVRSNQAIGMQQKQQDLRMQQVRQVIAALRGQSTQFPNANGDY